MNIFRSIIVLLIFNPVTVNAAVLFVDDDSNGADCSALTPCASIQQAINLASANDIIHVAAGTYTENITVPIEKAGLSIQGSNKHTTIIESAGGDVVPKQAPPGIPADIIVDIFAPNTTIANLSLVHPADIATKRDMGVFIRPPAVNTTIRNCHIQRKRIGAILEPVSPGSRAVFAIRTSGTTVLNNTLTGNYQDHIHFPTSDSSIISNEVVGATRIGITIIQENAETESVDNIIQANRVTNSGSDGIQIQGDNNTVMANTVNNNVGYGIHLCGPESTPACVPPGHTATASSNSVKGNNLSDNSQGDIADFGTNNSVN